MPQTYHAKVDAGLADDAFIDTFAVPPEEAVAPCILVVANDLELEGEANPAFGEVRWRTLFCADRGTATDVVQGIAEFAPGARLMPHRHGPSETYFGLSGSGIVTISGKPQQIAEGVAIFIPPGVEHGTQAGPDGLRFLYTFPRARFSDVDYLFST